MQSDFDEQHGDLKLTLRSRMGSFQQQVANMLTASSHSAPPVLRAGTSNDVHRVQWQLPVSLGYCLQGVSLVRQPVVPTNWQ